MGKSTHFTGQPVYTQVINLLDKAKIKQLSRQTIGSEKYVKRLDGWTHLIIMLFGVYLISFLENPNKDELKILSEKEISPHIQLLLFE